METQVADVTSKEDYLPFRTYRTWFRITGSLDSDRLPLVVAHGGPGCTHDYVDAFKEIAALDGRAVIHYDQLGNGNSTRMPDKGPDFWTPALFLEELDALLTHLGIQHRYAFLGQSWGGMLGAEHAVRQPDGLTALVIANSPANMHTWVTEANRLREALPQDVQDTLLRHERAGTLTDPDYIAASRVFYDRHVCRVTPWPPEVARTFEIMEEDNTVYRNMNGPTEFHVIGTMKDWTIEERLGRITAPTLLISGKYDEATPLVVKPYVDRVPDCRWVLFEHSSHMPHVEEKNLCMQTVSAFLCAHD
ncbi:proline iminopeptidase-family hydrolase [Rhizobium sp. VS19-DR104.2]|uniref:proline iminopeptidase-family hydrolase n=1 Tax=unclassified Rhizobium TaxID=2613769 RepID=UPI001CC628EB|nr:MULTISPECIES: proline iminopeptidase-family hydrolase [unclassified Rhizobium]MBZ5761368.1 proline iminopeptidase-family hydrolase [Rhizobium sp. VS19-DR96]MBZ5767122.1 proline iminopeptidase-family hydrolase [Rhizobium sp. VS19-DR129.2]MBZ5775007.1 proline iminopeptidase-family hydrolase [Rhizobium sp. VS19-DRK62.2]MBZ5785800.1 proline iminopeptidase-family hydrolase [Rhizobium sp. VS19-DR121]MBZ5803226.1 proline iminopeptidase-family hydrolase [Rhizobium sp. VS19-DR181]